MEASNFFRNAVLSGILLLIVIQTGLSIKMEMHIQKVEEGLQKSVESMEKWGESMKSGPLWK